MTQLTRPGMYDALRPRYITYPTESQFSGAVSAVNHADWIGTIPEAARISAKVSFPFCRRLCWFCTSPAQAARTEAPLIAYLSNISAELTLLSRHLPSGVKLSRLHWGGGTPSLMGPEMIAGLARAITAVLPLEDDAEFTVEIDPNEIDPPRMRALRAAGMTRAIIGVQDFDPEIQACIGRAQSYEVTREAIQLVREHGISRIDAEILYGLPHQSRVRITDSMQKLLLLAPDRVTLTQYVHAPGLSPRQNMIPTSALPSPAERLDLFETARKLLSWDSYHPIGIDQFALRSDPLTQAAAEGRLRRGMHGYTDDPVAVAIGLGAAGISRFPQGYTQNSGTTAEYTRALRVGQFATVRGHAHGRNDALRGHMIERLLCDFAIDSQELITRFGISPKALSPLLQSVAAQFDGQSWVSDTGLTLPVAARPLALHVAQMLDQYTNLALAAPRRNAAN
ncbi:radical SAM protein [Pseudooceanicola aestuarii]|uniref:radical SAM protein n=1 Tax=Pseudooceanicola aestuarii TaxID=2697319 RepID=UPI0030846002